MNKHPNPINEVLFDWIYDKKTFPVEIKPTYIFEKEQRYSALVITNIGNILSFGRYSYRLNKWIIDEVDDDHLPDAWSYIPVIDPTLIQK